MLLLICAVYLAQGFPHILTLPSSLPLTRVWPSGLNATDKTPNECSRRFRNRFPVWTFHILTVSSLAPLASNCPLELKVIDHEVTKRLQAMEAELAVFKAWAKIVKQDIQPESDEDEFDY